MGSNYKKDVINMQVFILTKSECSEDFTVVATFSSIEKSDEYMLTRGYKRYDTMADDYGEFRYYKLESEYTEFEKKHNIEMTSYSLKILKLDVFPVHCKKCDIEIKAKSADERYCKNCYDFLQELVDKNEDMARNGANCKTISYKENIVKVPCKNCEHEVRSAYGMVFHLQVLNNIFGSYALQTGCTVEGCKCTKAEMKMEEK